MNTSLPLVHSFAVLGRGPRRFLAFSFTNMLSWQALVGSVLVLHGRAVGLDARWVGAIVSLTPFTMLLSLPAIPLVDRVGPKRLMVIGWLCRSAGALPMAATAFIAARWGSAAAGIALMVGVSTFCVCRALSAVGWFPWLHELVPEDERGRYLSLDMMMLQFGAVAVGVLIFFALGANPALYKFNLISGAGVLVGFGSVALMGRIPGGAPKRQRRRGALALDLRLLLRDRDFCRYMGWSSVGSFVGLSLASLTVLHMRDYLGIAPARIMLVTAVGGLGALFANPWWGRLADRHGSGATQLMSGMLLGAALWWFAALRPGRAGVPACTCAYLLGVVGNAGFFISSNRGFLHRLKPKLRSSYSAMWLAMRSFAGGVSINLVGQLLHRGGPDGYWKTCAAYAGLIMLAALVCGTLPEKGTQLGHELRVLYRPGRPFWSLLRLCWHVVNPPER